jgi:hypothetical protein
MLTTTGSANQASVLIGELSTLKRKKLPPSQTTIAQKLSWKIAIKVLMSGSWNLEGAEFKAASTSS